MKDPGVVVSAPGTDKVLQAFGDEFTFHLNGEQTDGKLTVFMDVTPFFTQYKGSRTAHTLNSDTIQRAGHFLSRIQSQTGNTLCLQNLTCLTR